MNSEIKNYSRSILNVLMAFVIILFFFVIFTPYLVKGKVAEAVHKEAENMMFAKVEFSDLRVDMIKHFPMIAFNMKDIVITGTCKDFMNDTLLSASKIELTILPSSLFKKNGYEINQIALVNPVINALVAPDGKVNWNIFKTDSTHLQKDPLHPQSYSSFHLRLNKIQVKDGKISFLDLESMHGIECLNLNARLSGDLFRNNPLLKLQCGFDEVTLTDRSGDILENIHASFYGTIQADFSKRHFILSENRLKTGDQESTLKGAFTIRNEGFSSTIQFNEQNVQIEEILYLISAMYLKKYDFNNSCIPFTHSLINEDSAHTLPNDSLSMLARQKADSILSKAGQEARALITKAKTPLMKTAAEKAALKIAQKAHYKAKSIIEEADKKKNK